MNTFNILVLDGGGVRGLFTAQILSRLHTEFPELINQIDLICGVSTGSIIGLAIASGMSPKDIASFYKKCLPKIFKDSYWDDVVDLGNMIGADYDYNNLKKALKENLGTKTLGELNKKVLVLTFDLDNEAPEGLRTWKPKFYNNYQDSDLGELVIDTAVRSAAAPSYFPVYQGFIDGGLVTNTPCMAAIAQALDINTANQKLENIRLLSLGTGYSPTFISGKKLDWGVSQWAGFLVPIFIDAMMFSTKYQCEKLLGNHYHRLDAILSKKVDIDDLTKLDYLIEEANSLDLASTKEWLVNSCK
jgi:patatin-like phospholipase/acyl hydrolase